MEIFVKMTATEYETFKKFRQRKEPAEMDVDTFLRLKGYRFDSLYFDHLPNGPIEEYEVWQNGQDKVLAKISDKEIEHEGKTDCNH